MNSITRATEIERIRNRIIEYTASWDLACKEYFARQSAFQNTASHDKTIETPEESSEQASNRPLLDPVIQHQSEQFSRATRTLQRKGFEYLIGIESCQARLAVLEGKTLFAPA